MVNMSSGTDEWSEDAWSPDSMTFMLMLSCVILDGGLKDSMRKTDIYMTQGLIQGVYLASTVILCAQVLKGQGNRRADITACQVTAMNTFKDRVNEKEERGTSTHHFCQGRYDFS